MQFGHCCLFLDHFTCKAASEEKALSDRAAEVFALDEALRIILGGRKELEISDGNCQE